MAGSVGVGGLLGNGTIRAAIEAAVRAAGYGALLGGTYGFAGALTVHAFTHGVGPGLLNPDPKLSISNGKVVAR